MLLACTSWLAVSETESESSLHQAVTVRHVEVQASSEVVLGRMVGQHLDLIDRVRYGYDIVAFGTLT